MLGSSTEAANVVTSKRAAALSAPAPVTKPPVRRPPVPDDASFTFVVVRTAEDLAPYRAAWDDLAREALEPNPFYESWMLLPAIDAFGAAASLQFVLVFAPSPDRGERVLCGFFPLERRRKYRCLPLGYLSLWRHSCCFLSLPLLRASCAGGCLSAFLDWLATDPRGSALLELPWSPGDGPFWQLLVNLNLQRSRLTYVTEQYARCLLRPRADAEAYLAESLTAHERKEVRRKEKRLADLGRVEYRATRPGDDVGPWTEAFLRLEAEGWKGRQGTAMASIPEEAAFFRGVVAEAARQGRLRMLGLFLNNEPIALKCNFLAGTGSFAFKIAFDERHGRLSPGYQLEIANLRDFHDSGEVQWMDSCSDCQPSMFDRLWLDWRVIQTLLLSTGRRPGDLVVSVLPLMRWLRRVFRRQRQTVR